MNDTIQITELIYEFLYRDPTLEKSSAHKAKPYKASQTFIISSFSLVNMSPHVNSWDFSIWGENPRIALMHVRTALNYLLKLLMIR